MNLLISRIVLSAFLLFCYNITLSAQRMECRVFENNTQNLNNTSNHCTDSYNYAPDEEHLDHTPIITINVNFHYMLDDNCEGNFLRPEDADPNVFSSSGVTVARRMISEMNQWVQDLEPYAFNAATPHITDPRIRYRIYTETDNIADEHGGIFFHCDSQDFNAIPGTGLDLIDLKNDYSMYGGEVIDVFVFADGAPCFGGAAIRGGLGNSAVLYTCGMFREHNNQGSASGIHSFIQLTNIHEIGHILGLHHPYFCQNPCRNLPNDLNDAEECGNPPGDPTVCSSDSNDTNPNSQDCPNKYNRGNNFMKQGVSAKNFTPCQLGIIHEHLVNTNPDYINDEICTPDGTIVIETGENIVWNGGKRINKNILVQQGARLIINCSVFMPENGQIDVEPGGELYINDGTITTDCGGTWHGIKIEGSQKHSRFGDVTEFSSNVIINNATIENAVEAIATFGFPDANPSNIYNVRLEVSNTTFRNNQRAVRLFPYARTQDEDSKMFTNCTFEIDNNYNQNHVLPQVSIRKISNTVFANCEFTSSLTASYLATLTEAQKNNLVAIQSYQGDFAVDISNFTGWAYGITYTGDASEPEAYSFTVTESAFECEYIGIAPTFVGNYRIVGNQFSLGTNFNIGFIDDDHDSRGIFHYIGSGYTIEGNVFSSIYNPNIIETTGILIMDSGDEANIIENNSFSNLEVANYAFGVNRVRNSGAGLLYNCIQNDNNLSDFVIVGGEDNSGIASLQWNKSSAGSRKGATGNSFSKRANSNKIDKDIRNNSRNRISYYHDNNNDERPDDYTTSNGAIILYTASQPDGCSASAQSTTLAEARLRYELVNLNRTAIRDFLIERIDGGNTTTLVQQINNMTSSAEFVNVVNAITPYLSTTTLTAAAQHPTVIENQILKQAIIENPDVLADLGFVEMLRTKENPMSSADMDEILSHSGDITERTDNEIDLQIADTEAQRMANIVLQYLYKADLFDYEEIRMWHTNKGSLHGDYAVAGIILLKVISRRV